MAKPPSRSSLPVDQDALKLKDLAQGVLDGDFRPRAASVRRLAEAVLDLKAEKKARKNAKRNKLPKIPNQKPGK